MDPNQPITTVRHVWRFECAEKGKMFPERFVRVTEGEKNVNDIASWEMLTKKLVTHTKCSIT